MVSSTTELEPVASDNGYGIGDQQCPVPSPSDCFMFSERPAAARPGSAGANLANRFELICYQRDPDDPVDESLGAADTFLSR